MLANLASVHFSLCAPLVLYCYSIENLEKRNGAGLRWRMHNIKNYVFAPITQHWKLLVDILVISTCPCDIDISKYTLINEQIHNLDRTDRS